MYILAPLVINDIASAVLSLSLSTCVHISINRMNWTPVIDLFIVWFMTNGRAQHIPIELLRGTYLNEIESNQYTT